MRPPCSILIAIGRVFLGAGSVAVRANFNGVFLFFACLVPVAAVCLLQFPLLWLAVCTLWLSVCMVACATFVPAVLRRDPLSDHAVPSVPSRPPLSQSFGCTRPPAALAHRRCCTLDHPPCDGNRRERNAVECAGGRGDTTTLHPLRPLLAHLTRCRCLSRRCRSLHRQLHTHTHTHKWGQTRPDPLSIVNGSRVGRRSLVEPSKCVVRVTDCTLPTRTARPAPEGWPAGP